MTQGYLPLNFLSQNCVYFSSIAIHIACPAHPFHFLFHRRNITELYILIKQPAILFIFSAIALPS
jgi:hypothetical protein